MAFAIAANPRATIYLYFFIPIPAALFGVLFIFKDFLGAVRGGDNIGTPVDSRPSQLATPSRSLSSFGLSLSCVRTGHAAHLGGAFFGLAFFAAARRGLLRRWR